MRNITDKKATRALRSASQSSKRRGRLLLHTLRRVGLVPYSLGLLAIIVILPSLARADQLEWTQKAGGAGATISASGPYHASDGSSNRLHSAVLQSSTVLQATNAGTWRLNSGYLTTFPPRPLVQCRNNLNTANCATWQNDSALKLRNDRGCATVPCAFSKGALHYYKYCIETNASPTCTWISAKEWSDYSTWCPPDAGTCVSPGAPPAVVTADATLTESANWYVHVRTYNGGIAGGQATYGPFGIDQTAPNAPTWSSPASNFWFKATADTDISLSDSEPGTVKSGGATCSSCTCQYQVESYNGGWVTTKSYTSRNCNAATADVATLGAGSDCRDRGRAKCRITGRATDPAGNPSGTSPRTFSADWLLQYVDNDVVGSVSGYPGTAIDGIGTYLGTLVAANNDPSAGSSSIYLLNSTAVTSARYTLPDNTAPCSNVDCGDIVGVPWRTYESGSQRLYFGTTAGFVFKLNNSSAGDPNSTWEAEASDELSLVAGWPVRLPQVCGAYPEITSGVVLDSDFKLVYTGTKVTACNAPTAEVYVFGVENEDNYDSDTNNREIILQVSGCAESAAGANDRTMLSDPKAVVSGADIWVHIGSKCPSNELYRVKLSPPAAPAGTPNCSRDLADEIRANMTGAYGQLFFGTMGGASARFYAIQNSETNTACSATPPDAYSDLAGFPFVPNNSISEGTTVFWNSTLDEAYFTDDSGWLYCVCQNTGTGCPAVGGWCKRNDGTTNFRTVALESGSPLRDILTDSSTGTLYVVSDKAKVYAIEALYDPSCTGTNCDGTNPGDQVGSAQGYPFDLGDGNPNFVTSTVSFRNVSGTKLVAVGTDQGTVFYLPVVP